MRDRVSSGRSDRGWWILVSSLAALVVGLSTILVTTTSAARPSPETMHVVTVGEGLSIPTALTADGTVVGSREAPDGWLRPFVWTKRDGVTQLEKPAETNDCNVNAVNDAGDIVGDCVNAEADGYRAFMWTKTGHVVALDSPAGAWGCSATSINSAGQILGECYSDEFASFTVVWTR